MDNTKKQSENLDSLIIKQEDFIKNVVYNCTMEHGNDVLNTTLHLLSNGANCPAIFDHILCWPSTAANTTATQPCPADIVGFDKTHNATKQCMVNGQWYINPNTKLLYTDYTQCFTEKTVTVMVDIETKNFKLTEEYMHMIKIVSKIGYSVSFSTLVIAFLIMISIKKLHCARNKLHMHLFASFIFRALMFLLKDLLFYNGIGFSSDFVQKGPTYVFHEYDTKNWGCRMFTSLWQYFITANYSWILMEGLYLHNLILFALFSSSSNSIKFYIILGWGLPILVVGSWIIARIYLDNNYCWTTNGDYPSMFLIIRIPTMISILMNLVLFINIARVLLSKLSSPVSEEARCYRRWARSTLVLVPLFGVHYAAFLGMSTSIDKNETVEIIWLFCDQLFASFQGFFVAVLYCFLNGEVRAELSPRIKSFLSELFSTACCQYLFNCGDFSRSMRGRASVCTTLSCSSLYASGVTHKLQNRRGRWNTSQQSIKNKYSLSQEKHLDGSHCCDLNGKSYQDATQWNHHCHDLCSSASCSRCTSANCFCANSIIPVNEMTSCLDHREKDCKHNISLDLEMIAMVHKT